MIQREVTGTWACKPHWERFANMARVLLLDPNADPFWREDQQAARVFEVVQFVANGRVSAPATALGLLAVLCLPVEDAKGWLVGYAGGRL